MKLKIFTKVSTFSKQRAHRGEILSKNSWKQDTLVNRAICINEKKKKNCQNCENFTRMYCILSSKREIEEEKRKNEQRDWTSRGEIKFSRRENGLLASPRLENCNCTRWKCPIWRAIWRVKIEADGGGGVKRLERKGLFPIKEAGWPPTTRSDLPLSRTSLSFFSFPPWIVLGWLRGKYRARLAKCQRRASLSLSLTLVEKSSSFSISVELSPSSFYPRSRHRIFAYDSCCFAELFVRRETSRFKRFLERLVWSLLLQKEMPRGWKF